MLRGIQSVKVVEMNNRDISLLALLERFDHFGPMWYRTRIGVSSQINSVLLI